MGASGPVVFARYAFPPNSHGYCGPNDHGSFFRLGVSADDPGLRSASQRFDGAWPYLELIAAANDVPDPLDERVVEAYWVGGPMLRSVRMSDAGDPTLRAFGAMGGPGSAMLTEQAVAAGAPHHSFAVFFVYPWSSLLTDPRRSAQALMVLDRCRIRWGTVTAIDGDSVLVESSPLVWDGERLEIGPPQSETAVHSRDGVGMLDPLRPGDLVALHWEWVCDRLAKDQVEQLRAYTQHHLDLLHDHHLRLVDESLR